MLAQVQRTEAPVVYLFKRPFSGQSCTSGRALEVRDDAAIAGWPATEQPMTLLLPDCAFERLGLATDARWAEAARHDGYVMLRRRTVP